MEPDRRRGDDGPVRVLVAVASRHGATREIARAIGRELAAAGVRCDVRDLSEEAMSLDGYDAVVLGSAVYMGHWMAPARRFVEQAGTDLAARPVWLFSSGPVGDPPHPPADQAVCSDEIVAATGAREHRVFAGRLDRHLLGMGERTVAAVVHAAEGDFRDWDEIARWARGIARVLRDEASPPGPGPVEAMSP